MCFKLINKVYSLRDTMSVSQKSVLAYLASRTNEKTGQCNPSLNRISEDISLSRRRVIDSLNWLEENNWIIKKNSINLTNQYNINLSKFSVNKSVDEESMSDEATPSSGIVSSPRLVSERPLNDHIKDHIIKDQYDHVEKICGKNAKKEKLFLLRGLTEYTLCDMQTIGSHETTYLEQREEAKKALESIGFNKKSIKEELLKHQPKVILETYHRALREREKRQIRNLGSYVRAMLRNIDKANRREQNPYI
jgi:hypothetical protein